MNTELYEEGLKIRKEVLGEKYVEESLQNATPFTKMIQDLATEYCWGAVWARKGLNKKTRSLINLGMVTALNRPNELRLHVKGALHNGCTRGTETIRRLRGHINKNLFMRLAFLLQSSV